VPSATDSSSVQARGSGCERNAEEYNMCHPRRGIALIFNHEFFDQMPPRSGTYKDSKNLSVQLQLLGFEIKVHNDLRYYQLSKVLMEST
jgi:caspase-like apoptosis-related cysteine protease